MKSTENLNDYELIYQIRMNDPEALQLLCDKYRGLEAFVYRSIVRNFQSRYSLEEWYQDCDAEMVKAVNRYHASDESSFRTFFEQIIRNTGMNRLRSIGRKQNDLSLDSLVSQVVEDHEGLDAGSVAFMRDEKALSEEKILEQMRFKMILEQLEQEFNDEDKVIYEALKRGLKKSEIMREYGFSVNRLRSFTEKCRRIRHEIDHR